MQYNDIRHPDPQAVRSQTSRPQTSGPQTSGPQQSHLVVFRDQSADLRFLTRSTRTSEHTTTWEDGNIYPVIEVDLSSAAHFASLDARERELTTV